MSATARRAISPARCQVCQRTDQYRLDERLALDLDTVASLAAAEGLPVSHVWDHRARHLDLDWRDDAISLGRSISRETLRTISISSLHDVRSIAHDDTERSRTRVEAHTAVRGYTEMIARHLLDTDSTTTDTPALVVQVVQVLRDRVGHSPEALAAIDAALLDVESDHAARP